MLGPPSIGRVGVLVFAQFLGLGRNAGDEVAPSAEAELVTPPPGVAVVGDHCAWCLLVRDSVRPVCGGILIGYEVRVWMRRNRRHPSSAQTRGTGSYQPARGCQPPSGGRSRPSYLTHGCQGGHFGAAFFAFQVTLWRCHFMRQNNGLLRQRIWHGVASPLALGRSSGVLGVVAGSGGVGAGAVRGRFGRQRFRARPGRRVSSAPSASPRRLHPRGRRRRRRCLSRR